MVATLTYASGQVRELPLEKGRTEDLKEVIKVYVGPSGQSSSLPTYTIIETVRRRLPQIDFVSSREQADVWLLVSAERSVETEITPGSSGEDHSSTSFETTLKLAGRIIRFQGPVAAKLVKKFSETGRSTERTRLAKDFAEEFIKLYLKANPGKQSATGMIEPDATERSLQTGATTTGDNPGSQAEGARVQPATGSPPHLKRESLNGESPTKASGPVAVPGGTTSVRTSGDKAEVRDGDILRTDTSLVTILANVIARNGRTAPEMRRDDFNVYEDGVQQDIAFFEPVERPFTVVLLVDASTSVDPQLGEIVKAAKVLVDRLRPDDQLVIVTFNKQIKEVLKLTNVRDVGGEAFKIVPQGGTRLYDAVDFAASHYLRRLPGRKAVVLLTDGVDLGSFKATAEGSLHDAEEYDALFFTVQYKTFQDHPMTAERAEQEVERATSYLRRLAEKAGGRHYRAEDMSDLSPAFASIVKELSNQYSLGYYPTRPPQPGERRQIKVRVKEPDLLVHTRDSYVSKSP